jgi:hypothetical protein
MGGFCAALCAGKTWADVRARNPPKATTALYAFVVEEPLPSPDALAAHAAAL